MFFEVQKKGFASSSVDCHVILQANSQSSTPHTKTMLQNNYSTLNFTSLACQHSKGGVNNIIQDECLCSGGFGHV